MAPLIALVGGFTVLRLLGLAGVEFLDHWQTALRGALALMFVLTGVAHFVQPRRDDLIAMVPPALPRPALLVTVTGVLELAGAAALLLPPLAPHAALGLAALVLAMFPANVSAARRGLTLAGRPVTPLPTRTVLQVVFAGAALAAAVPL